MSRLFLILLLLINSSAMAESILLRVEVKQQKPTGYYPPCKDENGVKTDCVHWSGWTIYQSRVIEVIDGDYKEGKVDVAVLQHANFVPEAVKDVYLIIEEFNNPDIIKKLATKYYSDGPIGAIQMVCLPRSYIEKAKDKDKFSTVYWKSTDGKDFCYTKRGLDFKDDEED